MLSCEPLFTKEKSIPLFPSPSLLIFRNNRMSTFARDELISSQLEYTTIDPSKCCSSTLLEIGSKDLLSNRAVDVGIWEHPVGESTDVEVEEVFFVIEGTGTVYIEDGSNRILKLAPGTTRGGPAERHADEVGH